MFNFCEQTNFLNMANEPRKIDELSETEKKAIIIQALNKEGYNDNQASKLISISRARVSQINKKAKKGLLTPLVHKAKKSIALLVEGKRVGDMSEVKGSDVTAALKMVVDRYEPIVQKVESSSVHTYQITDDKRARYEKLLGLDNEKAIDATFEPVVPKQIEAPKEDTDGKKE